MYASFRQRPSLCCVCVEFISHLVYKHIVNYCVYVCASGLYTFVVVPADC